MKSWIMIMTCSLDRRGSRVIGVGVGAGVSDGVGLGLRAGLGIGLGGRQGHDERENLENIKLLLNIPQTKYKKSLLNCKSSLKHESGARARAII